MHIYIISQHLSLKGNGDDSFYKLAHHNVLKGHKVTVFASADGLGMELGQKNIGLFQKDGIMMVAFNAPYNDQMSRIQMLASYIKFARMAGKQGPLMPKPDILIAATPPLSAVAPAIKLKQFFKIPLVLEVRELWPDALVQGGTLKNRFLIKKVSKFEEKVYRQSDRIVTGDREIAALIRERCSEQEKVTAVTGRPEDHEIKMIYDRLIEELALK